MKTPDISVVVCTYNRAEMLRGALESVVCQETDGKFSYEIIVIDDASTDGTSSVVKKVSRRSPIPIRYVCEEGHGIAQARNRGIKESCSKWVAFFDDDQLAEPHWLKELFMVASKTGAYCVGGTRLLSLPAEQVIPLTQVTRSILGEEIRCKEAQVYSRRFLPGTGNILIKRSIFNSIGEFDPSMIWGEEDLDLIRRIRAAAFPIWSAPKAVVYHLIPPYRVSVEYLKLVSYRWGSSFACVDYKEGGRTKLVLLCVARIGQALLVNIPLLFWAYLFGDDAEVLGRKCLLWRAVSYTRETLYLLAPRVFPQEGFFARLEFRKERTSFRQS